MSAAKNNAAAVSPAKMYDLVLQPVITEKSTRCSEHNQVVFNVPLNATKPEISSAVEQIFNVKVDSVNTLRTKGKVKRFRGHKGRRSDTKKAMITLAEGHSIDMSTGI